MAEPVLPDPPPPDPPPPAVPPPTDMRFDHIGVVVPSLAQGRDHLAMLFGVTRWTAEFADPVNHVMVQFGQDAWGVCYETIAPFGANSPVALALRSGQRILNHVAYLVPDLETAATRLCERGCAAAGAPNPAIAYGNRRIQFFMTPLRVLVELIEAPDHAHLFGDIAVTP